MYYGHINNTMFVLFISAHTHLIFTLTTTSIHWYSGEREGAVHYHTFKHTVTNIHTIFNA